MALQAGDDSHPAAEPRTEAVAGKICCIAELKEEYIARMKDVLKPHEEPLLKPGGAYFPLQLHRAVAFR
jgi:hypothetical protein